MAQVMLTTIDNPFDPFTQFEDWLSFDERNQYYTLPYLGRIVKNSEELSPVDQHLETERAIDEIVRMNINGMYKKVTKG